MDAPRNINAPEWTVSELSAALKKTVEDAYGFVRVRGELGNVKYHSSGHVYLDLKDDKACIGGVIWRGVASRVRVKLEAGLEVVATGRLTTYPGQSKYQIVIDTIEPAGIGALMALVEARKKALAAEGLFDPARKQLLPFLPRVIGVVTSPTGAVIRDILHRLSDRFPRHVLVWPVRVQGEGSAGEVAAAIRGFNALPEGGRIPRPDVVIVARGGGSLEDLWSFNEEIVVRAAAESMIPLISAVGHETDVTLIDFAADVRAPTPTAAAELAVPVRSDLMAQVDGAARRALGGWRRGQDARRSDLRAAARALPTAEALLSVARQRIDIAADRLPRALRANAQVHHTDYSRIAGRLTLTVLARRVADERRALVALAQRAGLGLRVQMERRGDRFGALASRLAVALRANAQARRDLIVRSRERLAGLGARAALAMRAGAERRASRLGRAAGLLEALSYHGVLARGFALVRAEDGAMLRCAAQIGAGQRLDIEFADGHISATADRAPGREDKEPHSSRARGAKIRSKIDQGDLF